MKNLKIKLEEMTVTNAVKFLKEKAEAFSKRKGFFIISEIKALGATFYWRIKNKKTNKIKKVVYMDGYLIIKK